MKKEFDKIVRIRRSVRRYKKTDINDDDVKASIRHASLAPNSSNLQLWEFYHVTSEELMNKISESCFDQPAARTANQFVVIVTRKDLWNKRRLFNINTIKNKTLNTSDKSLKNKNLALKYYKYLIPTIYLSLIHI